MRFRFHSTLPIKTENTTATCKIFFDIKYIPSSDRLQYTLYNMSTWMIAHKHDEDTLVQIILEYVKRYMFKNHSSPINSYSKL